MGIRSTGFAPSTLCILSASISISISMLMGCGGSTQINYGPSLSELPECRINAMGDVDTENLSLECAGKLFVPLVGAELPFDTDSFARAMSLAGFRVGNEWRMTALHQYEGEDGGHPSCFFSEYMFAVAQTPLNVVDCGELLLTGGHPQTTDCQAGSRNLEQCVEEVPVSESFDIVVHRTTAKPSFVGLDTIDSVEVGDPVFLVGRPFFPNLSEAEQAEFTNDYPLVSFGTVVAKVDRAIVTTNLAMFGNSGGPLVNENGNVIGVLSARVSDIRARGVAVDEALLDDYSVSTAVDSQIIDTIVSFR